MLYILPTHKYFFVGGQTFFRVLQLGGGKISNFLETFYFRGPNLLTRRGDLEHKSMNNQSCKRKSSWWKNYLSYVCMLTFLTFTWEFSLWKFSVSSSVHWNSQKSVYYCLVISLWKNESCLIWALNKSILFGSNSLKVSVLYF